MRVSALVVTASSYRRPRVSQSSGRMASCSQHLAISYRHISRVRQPSDHFECSTPGGDRRASGLADPAPRPRWHPNGAPIGRPAARRNGTRNLPESKPETPKERRQNGIAALPANKRWPKPITVVPDAVKPGFQCVRTPWNQGFTAFRRADSRRCPGRT